MYYSIYLEAVVERIVELVRYGPPPAQERLGVCGVLGLAELEFYLDLFEVVLFVVSENEVCK